MPDQSQPTDDRNPDGARSVLSTTLVFLSAVVVVGFLYFTRDVSLIITSAPARVRYLVRRIRRRAPDAKVLVGLRGFSPEGLAAAKAALGGSVEIVTSVRVPLPRCQLLSAD